MTAPTVTPFLMFQGVQAEAAMRFYTSLFPDGKIDELVIYGPSGPGPEGSVMKGRFTIGGQTVRCTDSFVTHAFTFTPSSSLWVDCTSETELRRIAAALGEGGGTLMPVDNYGFSTLFTWLNDRFGVSWQLSLA